MEGMFYRLLLLWRHFRAPMLLRDCKRSAMEMTSWTVHLEFYTCIAWLWNSTLRPISLDLEFYISPDFGILHLLSFDFGILHLLSLDFGILHLLSLDFGILHLLSLNFGILHLLSLDFEMLHLYRLTLEFQSTLSLNTCWDRSQSQINNNTHTQTTIYYVG